MDNNQDFINRLNDRRNQVLGEAEMLYDRMQLLGRSIFQLIEYAKPIPKSLLYEYEYHRKSYLAKRAEEEVVKNIQRVEDRYASMKTGNITDISSAVDNPNIGSECMPQDAIKKRISELKDEAQSICHCSCPEDAERIMHIIATIQVLTMQLQK